MKATEVMLNDLVMCNKKVCKVCSIEGVMVLVSFKDGEKLTIEDNIEPIPLTAEILEKNGFEKQGFDGWLLEFGTYAESGHILWRTDYGEPHLLIESYSSKHGDFRSFGICYVHELQHALKLCGIEKEIIL